MKIVLVLIHMWIAKTLRRYNDRLEYVLFPEMTIGIQQEMSSSGEAKSPKLGESFTFLTKVW